jgi:hypothetical protein
MHQKLENMPFNIKKRWIAIICVLSGFILLNPSYSDFREFVLREDIPYIKRDANFVVFSIYSDDQERYLAFLKNFIHLKSENASSIKPSLYPSKSYKSVDTTEDGLPIIKSNEDSTKLPGSN